MRPPPGRPRTSENLGKSGETQRNMAFDAQFKDEVKENRPRSMLQMPFTERNSILVALAAWPREIAIEM